MQLTRSASAGFRETRDERSKRQSSMEEAAWSITTPPLTTLSATTIRVNPKETLTIQASMALDSRIPDSSTMQRCTHRLVTSSSSSSQAVSSSHSLSHRRSASIRAPPQRLTSTRRSATISSNRNNNRFTRKRTHLPKSAPRSSLSNSK